MTGSGLGSAVPSVGEILEVLLFASDEPISLRHAMELLQTLDTNERPRRVSEEILLQAIQDLNDQYQTDGRAFRIVRVAGGYQFATIPRFAVLLGKMVKERARRKLTQAALESLAVIAYKQPVTKPEIESIRGVNADYVVRSLLERDLITIVGRSASPGRPLLYGTTKQFLKHFGLNDLSELPKPREIDELLADEGFEAERRMLEELEAGTSESAQDEEVQPRIVVSEEGKLTELGDGNARDPEAPPGMNPGAPDEQG